METVRKRYDADNGLEPYGIEFTDGYYSVRQCFSMNHAKERAREDHGHRTVKSIRKVT